MSINLTNCCLSQFTEETGEPSESAQEINPLTTIDRPASVAQWAEAQCAPAGTVCRRGGGSIPGSAGRFRVRISGAHALRLISRAGKEGSTVSSIICDRWLILS